MMPACTGLPPGLSMRSTTAAEPGSENALFSDGITVSAAPLPSASISPLISISAVWRPRFSVSPLAKLKS